MADQSTPSEAAKKLAATIVRRANEGDQHIFGVSLKPRGLETLIQMYFDDERKTEREACAQRAYGAMHPGTFNQRVIDAIKAE